MTTRFDDLQADAELDALLAELPAEDRALLLEEHRQLEKDLLRLADPLPPPDFVAQVMKRVERAPARPMSKAEVLSAVMIVAAALGAATVTLVTAGSGTGGVGLALARLALEVRSGLVAMGSGLAALWSTAALPMVVGLLMAVGLSLGALKRFALPAGAQVKS